MEDLDYGSFLEESKARNAKYFEDDRIRKENVENKSNFSRGLSSSLDQTVAMLAGGVGLFGDAVNIDWLRDAGFKGYERNMYEASLNPLDTQNFTDIEGVEDAYDWFTGTIGQLAPSMGESIIATLAGGGIGGLAAKKLAKTAIKEAVEKQVKSGVKRSVANKVVKDNLVKNVFKTGYKRGANVGMQQGTAILEGGGMWGEDATEHGVENANAFSAFALGNISGASELVSPGGLLIKRIAGAKGRSKVIDKVADTFLKRVGKEVPEAMGGEAAQEIFQSFLGILNKKIQDPSVSLTDKEAIHEYINSGAAGAAGGLLFGGASAVFPEGTPKDHTVDDVLDNQSAEIAVGGAVEKQNIQAATPLNMEANTVGGVLGEEAPADISQPSTKSDTVRLFSHIQDMALALVDKTSDAEEQTENPAWVKFKTLEKWEKETGEDVLSYVNSTSARETLNAIISGEQLTEQQTKVWGYLKSVAENQAMAEEQGSSALEDTRVTIPVYDPEKHGLGGESPFAPGKEETGPALGEPEPGASQAMNEEDAQVDASQERFDDMVKVLEKQDSIEALDKSFNEMAGTFTANPEMESLTDAWQMARDRVAGKIEETGDLAGTKPDLAETLAEPTTEKHEVIDNTDSVAHGQEVNVDPSEKQKDAENYKMAHAKVDGFDISIENPAGSTRKGKDSNGKEWESKMENDYGRIKGTVGADKDHVDVFITKGHQGGATHAFVINQHNADGSFDEHKVVFGATSAKDALEIYNSNYEKGWTGGKSVTPMLIEGFKGWVKSKAPAEKGPVKNSYTVESENIGKESLISGPTSPDKETPNQGVSGQNGEVVGADKLKEEVRKVKGKAAAAEEKAPDKDFQENTPDNLVKQLQYTDEENGVSATVYKVKGKDAFRVIVRDTEANETATSRDYPGVDGDKGAVAYAKKATGKVKKETPPVPGDKTEVDTIKAEVKPDTSRQGPENPPSHIELNQEQPPTEKELTPGQEDKENKRPEKKKDPEYGSKNKLVSNERADELRARLKEKLKNLNSGMDPEIAMLGMELAVFHVEAGARTFAQYAKAVIDDMGEFGETAKPFLKMWYNAARDYPGIPTDGMDDHQTVSETDVETALKAPASKKTEKEKPKTDSDTGFSNLMDPNFGNDILADSFPTPEETTELPEGWPERTIEFANFFFDKYDNDGWNYSSITQARKEIAEKYELEQTGPFRKAVDEAMEYAIVQISRRMYTNGLTYGLTAKATFDNFVRLYEAQPRLATRTTESIQNQAYSTPAPIAFLASGLAWLDQRKGETVYEPTAGTGMLLMGADPDSVVANEMDDIRAAILRDQFTEVLQGNALDVELSGSPDVVITNPPFGKVRDDAGNPKTFTIDGFDTKEIDQAITLDALEKMDEKGRAVLIIGGLNKQIQEDERAKKYSKGAKKRYFEELYGKFNVVDHFTVSGDLYHKQGAAWPIDVIVIHGKGQSQKATPGFEAPTIYKTYEELGDQLEKISMEDAATFGVDATRQQQEEATPKRGHRTVATGSPYAPVSSDNGSAGGQTVRPGKKRDGQGTSSPAGSNEQAGQNRTPDIRSTGGDGSLGPNIPDSGRERGTEDVSTDQAQGGGTDRDTGSQGATGDNDNVPVVGSSGGGSSRKVIASEGQTHYKPESKSGEIGTLTPANMSKPLQDALKLLADKHGSIDDFVQKSLKYKTQAELHKAFSAEQVDAVALALDNIENGNGFILGDQTGIGKGRVVAAMIRYAYHEGKVPVFMTEKQALYADMYRDMIDIGFTPDIVKEIMQTNNDTILLDEDNGVKLTSPTRWNATLGDVSGMPTVGKGKNEVDKRIVFTTYDQLNNQFVKKTDKMAPRRRFLSQLMNNEKVVLIMDEAHNAGGSGDLENQRPDPATGIVPHPRALLMRQLIPLADGVVYSSATYAKNPDVMDLYSATDLKLGVGGDIGALSDVVKSGGIPFQQITAGMLSKAGQYIRRERSFDGVTYQPAVMEVDTAVAEDVSAAMAQVRIFEEMFIEAALEADGDASGSNAVGAIGERAQTFTSLMHNIIDQMLLSLKVKPSVALAIETLKKGEKDNEQVVLTVSNTMGAFLKKYANANNLAEGDEVKAEFNDLLKRYLYNTRLYTTDARDEKGKKIKFSIDDDMLGAEGVKAYDAAMTMIGKMDLSSLPVSPVDYMLNELKQAGFPALEITGRDVSIDYSGDVPVLSKRDPFDRSVNGKNKTIRNYNDGKNRVIILNRSGSTGISLHASERNPVNGQGKRHMIVVQAEKDINVHMQMLGRVHRTGQVIEPAYIQAVANIPAEMKPAALLLAAMASLNANTTADADSLFTDKGTVNFLNKYGDRVAAEMLHSNPILNRLLGSPMSVGENGQANAQDLMKKVTGRLPLLPIKQQEQIYAELIEAYKDLIAELDSTGRNDLEAKTFDLAARTIETTEVSPKFGNSPFEGAAIAEKVDMKRVGKPHTGAELKELVESHKEEGEDEATGAIEEFGNYRNEVRANAQKKIDEAKTDSERDGAEQELRELNIKLEEDINNFTSINYELKVGATVSIDLKMGPLEPPLSGVVIGKIRRGNPRNPLALSTWRVKIAVADGIRVVNLPFSKFNTDGQNLDTKTDLERWPVSLEDAAKAFDKALSVSREERWIVTGNLFTGYSTFQKENGQIINFTRDTGETEQGVLMPRNFDPSRALNEAPVVFESYDQVEQFLGLMSPGIVKLRQPGELFIVGNNGQYNITTHTSGAKAGRFFRDDRALLDITGSFTSSGRRMKTENLSLDQVQQVFELFKDRGNTWFTEMGIPEARAIVQGDKSKPKSPLDIIKGEDGRAYILEDLVKAIYKTGQTLAEFTKKLKEKLGKAFAEIADQVKEIYNAVNNHLETFTSGAQAGNVRIADEPKAEKPAEKSVVADDTTSIPAPLTPEFLEETAGSITYQKRTKIDSTFLDRVFSTPEYYFKKFAAAGRVLQAALLRRDIRYEKEIAILGDFVKFVQNLRKTNIKAYNEANDYLISTDQDVDGYRLKSSKNDDSWSVMAPLWAVNGDKNKQIVGIFDNEQKAVKAMIEAEARALQDQEYSRDAIKAVIQARELANRGFDVMAEDMRKIIEESKENGEPNPFIGDGKLDEAGRYGVYAAGHKKPIALFASSREADQMLDKAAQMISYMIVGGSGRNKNFKNELRAKAYARKHGGTVNGVKVFGNLSVKKRSNADMRPLTVKEALAQMGDLRGIYFPRIRDAGEYILIARKDGENPIRKHFDLAAVGDNKPTIQRLLNSVTPIGREAKKLKLRGYTVNVKRDESPAEDVFQATSLITSLDAIVQGSLDAVDQGSQADIKAGQHINQILTMQIADIFKSRGYLSSRLKRLKGDEIWEGYEEDMGKAFTQYGKNVAAGTAKRDTARAMVLAFTGRDYSWAQYKEEVANPDWKEYKEIIEKRRIDDKKQKNLFRDVRAFMIDILRNDEQADRIIGTFKGLAVLKYLGFRVSSATVNITNMVQGVPATLAGHTGESIKDSVGRVISAATAYGKYRSGKGQLSKADRAIFQAISAKGWDEAQFNYEAAAELSGKLGESWNKFMTASMYMFGAAEKANRAMTIFAAYKAVKAKNPTAEEDVIWEKAKDISDRAHGIYGKETYPVWIRGKYNVLRLTYTFVKFSHNYMLNMMDLGFTKKEYKAAAYMLLSPAILAGSTASIISLPLFAAFGLGSDDPEEEFYKWAEDTFGAGTFARHGIFGALSGINIRGSLQMNNPMPTSLEELFGPVGGIYKDTKKGVKHLLKGELAKGTEALLPTAFGSFSKSLREGSEGITTGNYGSVFYGNEPLKADATDVFLRFLSFNPSRLSGIREMQWHERKAKARYQEDKTAIYAKIKRRHINGKGITPEILKEIYIYNERVAGSGRRDITRITAPSIRSMLKRNRKASKIERNRVIK